MSVLAMLWSPDCLAQGRRWRLAGVIIGESIRTASGAGTQGLFKVTQADSRGGQAEITIANNARTAVTKQRMIWKFPENISVLQPDRKYAVQFGLEGGNQPYSALVDYLTGSGERGGAASPSLRLGLRPGTAALFSANSNRVSLLPGEKSSGQGTLRVPVESDFRTETMNFWFTVYLNNGEVNGAEWWEIHYIYLPEGSTQTIKPPQGAIFVPIGATSTSTPAPPPRPRAGLLRMFTYWNSSRGDNFTSPSDWGRQAALSSNYQQASWTEGQVFSSQMPGTVPLKLYWSAARGDNFSTATAIGERDALAAGYQFVRIEGWVYPEQRPGTIPLKLFWSAARADNFTTSNPQGEAAALSSGYVFVRVEGWVYP